MFLRSLILHSMCIVRNYFYLNIYITDPVTNGMATANGIGNANGLVFFMFWTINNPTGNPAKTPHQKPLYYVCLNLSKATFIAETSYESYLKSAILLINFLIDKIIRFFIFLHPVQIK